MPFRWCGRAGCARGGGEGGRRLRYCYGPISGAETPPISPLHAHPPALDGYSRSAARVSSRQAWPESAMYPHGAGPKRMQPSPWYDGETTANDIRAATAGAGMKRVAANHRQAFDVTIRQSSFVGKVAVVCVC